MSSAQHRFVAAGFLILALLPFVQGCLKSSGPVLPQDVVRVIGETGVNRTELTKTIVQYYPDDSLKLKAAYFLIRNIARQYSVEYELVDSRENKIPFQATELDDSIPLKESWELVSGKHGHPRFQALRFSMDRDTLTASFLVKTIDLAVESRKWPWATDIHDTDFYENVLPYRVFNEYPDDWRQYLADFILPQITDSIRHSRNQIAFLVNQIINHLIVNDNRFSKRTHFPTPKEVLERGRGSEEEICDLKIKILRSIGIPAALDYFPYAVDGIPARFIPVFLNENNVYQPLLADEGEISSFKQIPKVFRRCFRLCKEDLFTLKKPDQPSPPFLGHYPQIDVTRYYVPIDSIVFEGSCDDTLIYLTVLHDDEWKAIDWAFFKEGKAVFHQIGPIKNVRFAQMKAGTLLLLPQ